MTDSLRPLSDRRVRLLPGLFQKRYDVNRLYVQTLQTRNLLQNHYLEAGLWAPMQQPEDIHWGWESPTCFIRGQFLGHWLSAAAHIIASSGDQELKGKADFVLFPEIAACVNWPWR